HAPPPPTSPRFPYTTLFRSVLCCGYTGVKNLYLDEMARRFAAAGFVSLTFDYKGWGDSEGPPLRLAPYGRVEDTQAALTFLSTLDRKSTRLNSSHQIKSYAV